MWPCAFIVVSVLEGKRGRHQALGARPGQQRVSRVDADSAMTRDRHPRLRPADRRRRRGRLRGRGRSARARARPRRGRDGEGARLSQRLPGRGHQRAQRVPAPGRDAGVVPALRDPRHGRHRARRPDADAWRPSSTSRCGAWRRGACRSRRTSAAGRSSAAAARSRSSASASSRSSASRPKPRARRS